MDIPPIQARPSTYPNPTYPPSSGIQAEKERARGLLEGITLKMTAKGRYYWDIQAYGILDDGMIAKLKEVDGRLKTEFPENATNIPEE